MHKILDFYNIIASAISQYPWIKDVFAILVNLILFCVFVVLFKSVAKKIKLKLKNKSENIDIGKQIDTTATLIESVVILILMIGFVMSIMNRLGIDTKPFLATAGIAGVTIGLATKGLLEDVLSGIFIILSGQLRIGDYVQVAGKFGIVENINIKIITIRDTEGVVHYIRNSLVDIVSNYSREYAYAFLDIGVDYDTNIENAFASIKETFSIVADNKELRDKIISDEIEIWGVSKFEDSSINIQARIKTLPNFQWAVRREFNKQLKVIFEKNNISIPFPHRTLVFKNKEENH